MAKLTFLLTLANTASMKRWLTLTILMVAGLSVLLLADREYRVQIHRENAQALAQASVETQNRLQVAFIMRLRAVDDLQAFMLASASLPNNETFNRFAAGVLDHYHSIHGLAYIDSNRIVRYFFPLKGNESAIGLDLMTRPAAPFVEKAIRERRMTVNDPTLTVQGSLSVIPRVPLYRGDQLLGLVQGVFDVSAILEEVLTGADPRFAAQLRDAKGHRFWGEETFSGETQTRPVEVGDNAWSLSVGWRSPAPGPAPLTLGLIWGAGGALLLSLLYIVNRTWTHTERLRTAVSTRTAALRETEERYRFLAENASDMIYRMSLPDGRYEYVSPSSTALFGYSPEEFYNSPLLIRQAMHPDWRGYFEKAWADLVHGIAPPTYEYQIIHKSGETRWLNQRNALLKNANGAPIAIQGIVTDITERKRAEEALARESHRNQVFLRNASDGVHILDADGNVLQVSDSFCQTLGYSREELIGANVSLWDAQWSPQELKQIIAEQIAKGGHSVVETRHRRRDGSLFDVEITGQPLELDGKPVLFNSARNITERKRAEDALRNSEKELQEAQRVAKIGSWDWDSTTDTITWSEEYYRIFGFDPTQRPPGYVDHLKAYTPESAARLDAAVKRNTQTGEPYELDLELARTEGPRRWITARSETKRDAQGQIIGLRGTAQDITERKRAELALEKANRALRTLSACNEALVRAGNESELLDPICRLIVETGGYRMAWVGFPEQGPAKRVRPVAHHGHDEGYLAAANISWADVERGRGPSGTAIRTGSVQIERDFLTNPALAPWREAARERGYRSSIALPLKSSAGTLGVLTIYAAERNAFDEAEVELLQELAEDLAFGIETLRTRAERDHITHEHLHHAENLRQSLEDSIKAVAGTVEMRDPYTAGHQRRVGELVVAISWELGLPAERIRGLELAASIHDLGKISVPAEILSKPTTLTNIEFMLIKNHAQAGYDILKDIKYPWPIATMVLQHHERLDGSGYPQGLKGDQILFESRIMAVADVVEAMASHRPYRAAVGIDAALKEIERGRDTLYDAAVVDACLKLLRQKRFAFSV